VRGGRAPLPAGGGRLVNYRDLPEALLTGPAAFRRRALGRRSSDDARGRVRDAKAPDQGFVPDGEAKRREADDDLRAICERRVGQAYRRLEALRAGEP
jgi:hypothetical protein